MAIAREQLIATVREFLADYPGAAALGFVIAETVEQIAGPGALPEDTLGFYIRSRPSVNQSLVCLPRANAESVDSVRSVLRHEVLGHFGMDTFSREEKAALLDSLIAVREERFFKAVWLHVDEAYREASLRVKAEEVFALRAQFVGVAEHRDVAGLTEAGQASLREVCLERRRPMAFRDFENIVLMVAQGLHDRTRVQRNFRDGEALLARERSEARKPLAHTVAESLIAQLRAGTSPLQRPWTDLAVDFGLPVNATTGKRYRGGNAVWLMMQGRSDPRWLTYKQAVSVGAQVRRGEHGTPIQYWRFEEERPRLDEAGRPILGADGEPLTHTVRLERPRAFTATVFNAEQVDGLPSMASLQPPVWEAESRAERLLHASGVKLVHVAGGGAFYRPSTDTIHLPERGQFNTAARYYAIALHELGHASGHSTRLNRDLAHPFGSEGYAKEELRAEIASLLLGAELGIGHDPGQHAAYVAAWIKALRNDPTEIFRAAADAEAILDFVLGLENQQLATQEASPMIAEEPAMQKNSYDLELARLLAASTLTPGDYVPTPTMKTGHHAAVLQADKVILLCGPADDRDSAALARRLGASPVLASLLSANGQGGQGGPLHAGMVAGAFIDWQPVEAAVVSKPSGEVETGGEAGPLVLIVRNDPLRALTTVLCVNDALARIIDPAVPELDDGVTLSGLARAKAEAERGQQAAPVRVAAVAQQNAEHLGGASGERAQAATRAAGGRVFLAVPFKEKDQARALGAKWDRSAQAWFVPPGVDPAPFARWSGGGAKHPAAGTSKAAPDVAQVPVRTYLAVPFEDRGAAKSAGALWDRTAKSWYAGPKADHEALRRWSLDAARPSVDPALSPQEEFALAMRALGCQVDGGEHPVMDGMTHRIAVEGDKRGERSGFYVGYLDGHPAGYVKNNRTGLDMRWKSKGYALDDTERALLAATAAQKLQERANDLARKQEATGVRLTAALRGFDPVTEPTPYLARKGVTVVSHLYTDKAGTTIIPAVDVEGRLWSVQYVQPNGTKRFAKNSRKEGCFHPVGGLDRLGASPLLVIAEGYATAASLSEALGGLPTVAAFDAGNLQAVASALHARWPQKPIVIAGDDDSHQVRNPGRRFAEAAARAVGGRAVFPIFAPGEQEGDPRGFTDFNDLMTKSALGREAIERQIGPYLETAAVQTGAAERPVRLPVDEGKQLRQPKARAA